MFATRLYIIDLTVFFPRLCVLSPPPFGSLGFDSLQVKEMLQREVQRAEEENRRNQSIISDYKQICSKLGNRLEEEQSRVKEVWQRLQDTLSNCSSCSVLLDDLSTLIASEQSSPDQIIGGAAALDGKPRSPSSTLSPFESQVE